MTSAGTRPDDDVADVDLAAGEPVAVIGMACRVPGAGDLDRFWHNVVSGVESRTELTRAQLVAAGVAEAELDDPSYVPVAFLLDDVEYFDAGLFGMTAREAELVDPQHRIFLELCHSALENAGCDPARFEGAIGVYGGRGMETYRWHHIYRNRALAAVSDHMTVGIGNHADNFTTLASFRLNLRGPSVGVYTACSTSLVAVHLAAEALRAGECDVALAGGVSVELPVGRGYPHHEGGAEAADGHCRPFDARATGTTWGSGGGVVALKRLSEARADGDPIRAVIRGNAINNDGSAKVGFTAPSVDGQMEVIAEALAAGGVDPRTVSYVETHGTGTALGDPIEAEALTNVFARHTGDRQWCALGSVKANVGHLSHGAGVVGVIKTVLAMEHGLVPPMVGFRSANPAIDFAASPFYVNAAVARWEPDTGPRRAGVSSFGIGGTNAHVVLEQAPDRASATPRRPAYLLQVSARSAEALDTAVGRLAEHLAGTQVDLADVSHTLRAGRVAYQHRAAVVVTDAADAVAALRSGKRRITGEAGRHRPEVRLVLLFPGQGAQYAGMGGQLYETEPVFAATVDRCAEVLRTELGEDLRPLLFATGAGRDAAQERLTQTALTQPALFTVEYALAELWRSWGLRADTMIGHSIGEYVAATLAGVFDLPDALRLVATRGRLMQSLPPGAMLAVAASEEEVAARLPAGLAVAAVNGPRACVVSGPTELVDELATRLVGERLGAKRLRTSHAFHSPMMAPILAEFTAAVAAVGRQAPREPFLSNRTGAPITPEQATDPGYWAAQLREPVRFGACVARVLADGPALFVECGPGRQLGGLARIQIPREQPLPLPSLPSANEPGGELATCYAAAGRLWVAGVPLDRFGTAGRLVPLPGYPYQRTYHWVEPDAPATVDAQDTAHRETAAAARDTVDSAAAGRLRMDGWFTVPTWHRLPPALSTGPIERCVVFAAGEVGTALVAALREAGTRVVEVLPGQRYERLDAERCAVRADRPEDYAALVADVTPSRVVHAWTLDPTPGDDLWQRADQGLFSVLYLVQALAGTGATAQVDVITAGTQQVLGDDLTRPADATVAGVLRSAPYDVPEIGPRQVDLDAGEPLGCLPALVAELGFAGPELVAVRGGHRWAADFAPVRVPEPAAPTAALREGGGYLVTGGLGALGLAVAEDLVRRVRARVVLLGRSALPPEPEWAGHLAAHGESDRTGRAIAAIGRMTAAGGQVRVVRADVTDPVALRRVREEVVSWCGGLAGIVHAAGVAGGGLTATRTRADMLPVLAPKLAGPEALRAAFGDLDLDFVTLLSSVVGTLGGLGEVDYCAANAYLDAYAQSRHGWRSPVRALAFTGWQGAGMRAEAGTRPFDHPVLARRDETRPVFHGTLRPESHWPLDEHRVNGVPLLPGTAQVDAARAAFVASVPPPAGPAVVELSEVLFTAPLFVADGAAADVSVSVRATDGQHDVTFDSTVDGARQVLSRATARWVAAPPAARLDLAGIRARCTARPDLLSQAREMAGDRVRFGPRWDTVREVWLGPAEQLTLLELPEPLSADLDAWGVHPALLDQATTRWSRPAGSYLPMAYGRLLIRGSLPGRVWVHCPVRDDGTGLLTDDFTIVDENGVEVLRVTEFTMRRVDHDAVVASAGHGTADTAGGGASGARRRNGASGSRTSITPAEGVAAFHRVTAGGLDGHVIVSPVPLPVLRTLARADAEQAIADATAAPPPPTALRASGAGRTAPHTDIEVRIAAIWSAVLGVTDPSVDDNFFELGGNSLVAVQLIAQVRKEVGVRLPMRSVFETPTIAGMANRVNELRASQTVAASTIPRLPRRAEPTGD